MQEHLVIHHHTSLGDYLICCGIVHDYAERYKHIYLPCYHKHYSTINCLYQDFPNIHVLPIGNNWQETREGVDKFAREAEYPIIRIGFEDVVYRPLKRDDTPSELALAINFDRQFYELAGVLYAYRYEKFNLPLKISGADKLYCKMVGNLDKYALVHDCSQDNQHYDGLRISTDLPIIKVTPDATDNLLEWIKVIICAEEIHVVPSSVYCLVDSVCKTTKAKLHFHDCRMNSLFQVNCKHNDHKWNIIEYKLRVH